MPKHDKAQDIERSRFAARRREDAKVEQERKKLEERRKALEASGKAYCISWGS